MESLLFPLLLALLAGFMFLSIRKQKKRVNEQQEMQNSVTTGTRVQLTSGLFGTVIDGSSSEYIDVEIATGVVTRWNRLAIMKVIPTEDAAATYAGAITARPEEIDDEPIGDADDESSDSLDLNNPADDNKPDNKPADTDK